MGEDAFKTAACLSSDTIKLSNVLTDDFVECNLSAVNRNELIDGLIALIVKGHPELDAQQIKTAIMEREAIFPTVIAPGLMVPHARLPNLDEPLMAVGISKKGIDLGIPATAKTKVKVAVMLLTPENNAGLHLQLLSALSQIFYSPEVTDKIQKMTNRADVVNLMTGRDTVPDYLKAGDLMDTNIIYLLETDTLRKAIHVFATSGESELPVIDDEGDLRGIISTSDLLKLSFPPHLLWMENLTPINRFQPFTEMLKTSNETRLADVMRDDYISVSSDIPAIQVAKLFIVNQVNKIVVIDGRKLIGMIRLSDFCAKLFWA